MHEPNNPHNWKEARRWQAWHLLHNGWPQRQIAEALKVSAAAVSQWLQWARDGGLQALHRGTPLPHGIARPPSS